MALYPMIMAGGSGTRFWPLSRQSRPKQFLALAGEKPMIVGCLERVLPLAAADQAYVVCGELHAPLVHELMPEVPGPNVLVEPVARNTAPAIALAAAVIAQRDPQGIMLVLPSDHHIGDPEAFRAALTAAATAADSGLLVTIGVKPTRPETGFGYVQQGAPLTPGGLPCVVKRFVEKPDLAKAEQYLASGDYLWNAGIFVFRVDRILEEIRRHLPEATGPLEAIGRAVGTADFARTLAESFPKIPSISIDYGVMEKAEGIAVVPAEFGWSDVGSFPALPEVRPLDAAGNVTEGEALLFDVADSVVLAGKRPVAVIGVEGMVVVDAGDAILVCPKDRAQDVRRIVEELSRRGLKEQL